MGNTPTEMPSAPPPHTTCTYIQYNMLHTSIFPDDILWGELKAVGVSRAGGRRGMVHISRCERGGFQQSLYFGLCTRVAEIHNENYLKATSFFFSITSTYRSARMDQQEKKSPTQRIHHPPLFHPSLVHGSTAYTVFSSPFPSFSVGVNL